MGGEKWVSYYGKWDSDLPLNKDALSGSESWPDEVKSLTADMCGKPEWPGVKLVSLLMSRVQEIPFLVHIHKTMYDNRNTEPNMMAELLCEALCNDAVRMVLPNLILSYVISVPRGRGGAGLPVLCRSVPCRLLFWITQNSFSLWSAR